MNTCLDMALDLPTRVDAPPSRWCLWPVTLGCPPQGHVLLNIGAAVTGKAIARFHAALGPPTDDLTTRPKPEDWVQSKKATF
jgi:hypothetical protein